MPSAGPTDPTVPSTAEPLPRLAHGGAAACPCPCLGVFELVDDSDLCSQHLFTEMGGSSRRLVAWWPRAAQGVPTCSCCCHPLLSPVLVLGLLRDNFCFCFRTGRLLACSEHTCAGEGGAQAHTERQKQTRVCCSKEGPCRLF